MIFVYKEASYCTAIVIVIVCTLIVRENYITVKII
jgi:hypothetical protein